MVSPYISMLSSVADNKLSVSVVDGADSPFAPEALHHVLTESLHLIIIPLSFQRRVGDFQAFPDPHLMYVVLSHHLRSPHGSSPVGLNP